MKILFIKNSCLLMSHSQIGYGIGIIATIAHNAGYDVKVIDNNTHYKYYTFNNYINVIRKFKPDILAYGITLHNAYETYDQIKKIKRLFPHIIIIAGGIHMKHCFKEALQHEVDIVVNREGEEVILPLLDYIKKQKQAGLNYKNSIEAIKGISFIKDNGDLYFAKEFPALQNLDNVPIVNYDLFNIKDFIKTGFEPGIFYINGQRGCPFGCNFCSDEIQRADRRMASADWMFKNVEYIYNKYSIRYILIADNNITLSKQRLTDFCNKMIESGLNKKITFSSQTTTRFALDEELIKLMKEAGFHRINFGVERLSSFSLKQINKMQPLDNVHKILSLVSKHNMDPSVFMMAGFPFETKELLEEEEKLFFGLTKYTHRLFLSILAPTPGTIYYDNNPQIKEWYLNKNEHLMIRAYFSNVLDMHTFHTIKKNFFNLSPEMQDALTKYYFTFKNINYGSAFNKISLLLSIAMKVDILVAQSSRLLFNISPSVEFIIFKHIKSLRYYLGSYFFGKNLLND